VFSDLDPESACCRTDIPIVIFTSDFVTFVCAFLIVSGDLEQFCDRLDPVIDHADRPTLGPRQVLLEVDPQPV
jgi:hypothetical protein